MGEPDEKKEVKPQPAPATQQQQQGRGRRNWRRGGNNSQSSSTKFKGKTKEIEDDIFDMGGSHDAALFSRSLKNISDYLQLKFSNDVSEAVRAMKALTITIPPPPAPSVNSAGLPVPVSDVDFYLWKREHTKAQDRKDEYDKHMKSAYTLIFHQCSHALKTELEASDTFDQIRSTQDVLALLTLIKGFCCSFDVKTQGMMATVEAHKRAYLCFQADGVDNQTYHREFIAHIETLESYGGYGTIGVVPTMLEALLRKQEREGVIADASAPSQDELRAASDIIRDEYLAALLLSGANQRRFDGLRTHLANLYAMGDDRYPKTVVACLSMLDRYNNRASNPFNRAAARPKMEVQDNVVFAQNSGPGTRTKTNSTDDDVSSVSTSTRRSKKSSSSKTSSSSTVSSKKPPIIKCLRCGQIGHISTACPTIVPDHIHAQGSTPDDASTKSDESEEVFILTQADRPALSTINPNLLLLDSQSTCNQFVNPEFVTNPRPAETPITIHCNAGTTKADTIADFGSTPVYVNTDGIANVLSLFDLGAKHRITYDSWDRNGVFKVHTPHGLVEFHPTTKGLHVLDLQQHPEAATMLVTTSPTIPSQVVPTIRDKFAGYTKHDVLKATAARRLQAMIGNPSERDFQGLVRANLLVNCPVTPTDIRNAHAIFGPDLPGIRGKTVRRKPEHVRTDYVAIPQSVITANAEVTLVADVMFVNGIPFLITLSRRINVITIEHAPNRTASTLATLLQRVVQLYFRAGFRPHTIMMDMEFDKVKDKLPSLVVNTTAAREHVAEIERKIRLVKERSRAIITTLPYAVLPKLMLIELLHFVVMWLNAFPVATGISNTYSPREFLLRHKLDARLHCKAPFGAYCEIHEDPDITNTMASRTQPAICLGPTGNLQGSYKFLSLATGKKVIRRSFTELPVPDDVCRRVEQIAKAENRSAGLLFTNRRGDEFPFSNDDLTDLMDVPANPSVFPDITAQIPGVDVAHPDVTPPQACLSDPKPTLHQQAAAAALNSGLLDSIPTPSTQPDIITIDDDDDDVLPSKPIRLLPHLPKVEPESPAVATPDILPPDSVQPLSDDTVQPPPTETQQTAPFLRRSTRTQRTPAWQQDYHLYTTVAEENDTSHPYVNSKGHTVDLAMDETIIATVCQHLMVHFAEQAATTKATPSTSLKKQYGVKAGLKRFGQRGADALMKELRQFHMLECFTPVDPTSLTREQRKQALASLMFLTEKRTGEIKARGCADGRTQREHIPKEETTSPTVTTDAIFITCTIAAHEHRDVGSADIPGAFLHAYTDTKVVMRLDGILAEMMVKVAPAIYRPFITTTAQGKPVLYVTLQKALYGMLKSALLFYRTLVADLQAEGFTLNPYDPCVANKLINGKQMTVVWHVDDLLVSHVDSKAVTKFLDWIKARYTTPDKQMKPVRGPLHDYLGMTLDFSTPGQVRIGMDAYIAKILSDFPEEITDSAPSPAADHLFKVRDPADAKPLPEPLAIAFHHTVAQLLFASTRARRDIQVAVAFLTTRVKSPDEDDWGKLKRVLKYLKGTRTLKLTLQADSLTNLQWYIDGSHQVHDDCRGHTGSLFTFGRGAISSTSRKQKINTKSSTETELIAVDDKLGDVLWTRYFVEAQGYTIESNVIHQDNMSSLSLEKLGRISSSPRTKHIKAKYFLIQDKFTSGEVDLKYCPTEVMWADVLTKPLQGHKFRLMRAFLMNCPLDYDEPAISSPMKKRARAASSSRECVAATPVPG